MNKLEYELNQVALKTREETRKETKKEDSIQYATSFIKSLRELGISRDVIFEKLLAICGSELSRDEITKLMKENY